MGNALSRSISITLAVAMVFTYVPIPTVQAEEMPVRRQISIPEKRMEINNQMPEGIMRMEKKDGARAIKEAIGKEAYVPGEVLVKFKKNRINLSGFRGKVGVKAFSMKKDLDVKDTIKKANITVMESEKGESVEQMIDRLKDDPNVEHVQPNFRYYPRTINTNDTHKDLLWGLDNAGQSVNGTSGTNDADIDAPEAWSISEGSNSVIVAVIDSGVNYNHPELAGNMWDGSSCKDDNGNVLGGCNHGYDYLDDDKTPLPITSSHGTHISGTISAVKNNNRGTIGVSPKAEIMAVKAGNDTFTTSTIIKSINFAEQNGADVINASWGSYGTSGGLYDQDVYNAISGFTGLFVVAAGNEGFDHDDGVDAHKSYPDGFKLTTPIGPGLDNIIAVAATDQNDGIASFSDYGATSVDVGAPGTNIYSTVADIEVLNEDFESVTPPAVPAGWNAIDDWGTYDVGGSFGNVLYGDVNNVPYVPNANSTTTLPPYSLNNAGGAVVDFWTRCDTELTQWDDYMSMEFSSDGITYNEIDKWNGFGAAHFEYMVPQAYLTSNFTLRFRWVSDGDADSGVSGDGCWVDEIKIIKYTSGSEDIYDYMQGTSMAAPHVAGLAALIKGYNSSLTDTEIKDIILDTGDPLASLAGKTVTGKRINAYNALKEADGTPPVITLLGDATVTLTVGDTYNDAGATALDDVDEDITANIVTVNPVNTAVADTYTVTYNVSDAKGNAATEVTRTVIVNAPDTTPPVITLVGDAVVNITVGDTYVDAGATALDNIDGDITANIVTVNPVNTAVAGTYTVAYNVSDAAGNSATEVTRTVNVNPPDITPPVITLLGSATVDINVGEAYVDAGATASDNIDGDITANIVTVNPVNTAEVGTYTVTYNVSDSAGNPATEVTRTVNVNAIPDTTPPVITLIGDATIDINVGDTYTDAGATASDNVDGDITANIVTVNPVNTAVAGTYIVTYNVSDAAGNAATEITRTVNVNAIPDTTPPVITLLGAPVVNIDVGDTYTDAGATASDDVDGDITANIITVNPVNTAIAGTYTVTYNVSDAAGNAAIEVTRTVNVNAVPIPDTTPPIITLIGDATVTLTVGDTYVDAGATAADDVDGDITANIVTVNPVNTAVAGTYTVTYNVSDAAGNVATEVTRTVTVNPPDTTPPVITLLGSPVVDINVGDTYTDAGATANDDVDGDITTNIVTVNPVNTAVAGTYTVTYNVSDTAGNAATEVTRTVNVNAVPDTTPPMITLLGNAVVNINVGDTYVDAGATALDDVDGDITANIVTVNPVNTAIAGTYTVTYNVSDAAGNAATEVTRTVNVSDVPIPDTTPPVITLIGGAVVNINVGDTYTDEGATALDNVDGDITANIVTVNPVNTAVAGTYTVTYNVSDTAGNAATEVTRTVNVNEVPIVDTTPPVISLIGSSVVDINVGDIYLDAGATASDNVDGDITANIVTVNPVNTSVAGTYTVTYNVSDAAGNAATEVTRTVNVNAVTPPDPPDPEPEPEEPESGSSITGLASPESPQGNGSSRGKGSSRILAITEYAANLRGLGRMTPSVLGIEKEAPLSIDEVEYICSIQRAMKEDSEPEYFQLIADKMAGIMRRDSDYVADKLTDTSFCESTNMALRPRPVIKKETLVAFPVGVDGYPVSSNPVWNACVRGTVTLALIKSNTDRDDPRDGGKPKTCADYHTGNDWRHPDFNIRFTFNRIFNKLVVPEGYVLEEIMNVAMNSK